MFTAKHKMQLIIMIINLAVPEVSGGSDVVGGGKCAGVSEVVVLPAVLLRRLHVSLGSHEARATRRRRTLSGRRPADGALQILLRRLRTRQPNPAAAEGVGPGADQEVAPRQGQLLPQGVELRQHPQHHPRHQRPRRQVILLLRAMPARMPPKFG